MSHSDTYADGSPAYRPRRRRKLEAELEQASSDYLGWDGWRTIKTDPKHLRGLGVIEVGIPDRLYVRYSNLNMRNHGFDTAGQIVWIEWKAPGGRLSLKQATWIQAERARGGVVWIAGQDFAPDYEAFKAFYATTGLRRAVEA